MKKSLLTVVAAACCLTGAYAQNTFDEPIPRLVDNNAPGEYAEEFSGHLIKSFKQTPKTDSNGQIEYQNVQTKYSGVLLSHTIHDFSNDFVVTANDLGDNLPKGAKVTKIGLDGYNNGGQITKFSSLDLYVWNVDKVSDLEYKYGYGDQWNTGMNASDMYCSGAPKSGFSAESTKDNLDEVVSLPFSKAFEYTGNDVQLKLHMQWQSSNNDEYMKFAFQKATAETKIASVYRSGHYAFSSEGAYYDRIVAPIKVSSDGISIDANTIPAFKLSYYTNDIHVKVQNRMSQGSDEVTPTAAYITLIDKTDNKVICDGTQEAAATEKWFDNLDYTHTYTLKVENRFTAAKEVELNFEDIDNDIEVVFTSTGTVTGVESANAAKTVASVKYYNIAGIESAQPTQGINIVKTTYTDGSQSVAKKLIK